jgi:hypothetical protein
MLKAERGTQENKTKSQRSLRLAVNPQNKTHAHRVGPKNLKCEQPLNLKRGAEWDEQRQS